jgi:hypothetical protein
MLTLFACSENCLAFLSSSAQQQQQPHFLLTSLALCLGRKKNRTDFQFSRLGQGVQSQTDVKHQLSV